MYKVMIVDDEPLAIMGIRCTFPWQKYGFEVIDTAMDPQEALDIIKKKEPHVVFTDVVMPEMRGMELMEKARKVHRDIVFIIVSGYADFYYAQESIRQGVFDYCLKPIKQENAEKILQKLKAHLDEKNGIYDRETTEDKIIYNIKLKKVLAYIQLNYGEDLTLPWIARKFDMNSSYLSTLFTQELGMGFRQYLTNVRMKEAKRLLTQTTQTIESIAQEVGMEYYYFLKTFRKMQGISAGNYRLRNEAKDNSVKNAF